MHLRTLRNLSFAIMLTVTVFALRANLLAHSPLFYCDSYDCDCNATGFSPAWAWEGSCDFQGETNPLEVGAEFCDGWEPACAHTCEDEYAGYLAYYNFPPVYEEPACFETWLNGASCEAGENTTQSCSCGYFNWCLEE